MFKKGSALFRDVSISKLDGNKVSKYGYSMSWKPHSQNQRTNRLPRPRSLVNQASLYSCQKLRQKRSGKLERELM
jgi:hypothetical protein